MHAETQQQNELDEAAKEVTLIPPWSDTQDETNDEEANEFAAISSSATKPRSRLCEIACSVLTIRSNNGWPAVLRNLARLTAFCAATGAAFLIATPALAATIAALKANFLTAADTMAAYVQTSLFDGWAYLETINQPSFDAVITASKGLTALALGMLLIYLLCQWRRIPKLTMFNQPAPANKKSKPLVETNHAVLAATTRTWDPRKPITHGGLVLGYSTLLHKMYLSGEHAHCIVQAPPGVGKTIRMIMATLHCIFQSDDSCIIVDPKGELYDNTYEAAVEACGEDHVFVIDFFRWRRSDLYNVISDVTDAFFDRITDYENTLKAAAHEMREGNHNKGAKLLVDARNSRIEAYAEAETRARNLANALIPDLANVSDQFWRPSARTLLTAMVLFVGIYREEDWVNPVRINSVLMPTPSTPLPEQRTLKTIRAILNVMGKSYTSNAEGKHEERLPLENLFAGLDQEHPAARAFTQAKNTKGQTLAGICSTLLNVLDSIVTEESNMMSYATDFDLDLIGDEKTIIYFIVPESQPAKYAYLPVFITQAYQACARAAARNGGEMKRYVHFILEEFGNSPRITLFPNMINAGRGYGCRFYAVMQNAAQWSVVYGQEAGRAIVESITCRCYLKVVSDEEAKTLSESIGKCMVKSFGTAVTSEATGITGARISENESTLALPYVPIETITSWNPMWGTFVRRSELDENKLLNRVLFHRKRANMAVYPTAAPQFIPTLAAFGLVRRDEAALRARRLQSKDKTAERALIPPWLGEKIGSDTKIKIAEQIKPGSIDSATATALNHEMTRLIATDKKVQEHIKKDVLSAAKKDADTLCTPEAIAAALRVESQDKAVTELYRKCKKQLDRRLTHSRALAKQFEQKLWSTNQGTYSFEMPKYKQEQLLEKEIYLGALREEIERLVQQQKQAA